MKQHHLYLTVRVSVESDLSLSDTVQEFEQETAYSFPDTENVKVIESEILKTMSFNPIDDSL